MAGSISQDLIVEAIHKGFREVQQELQRTGQAAQRSGEQAERGGQGVNRAALMWTELNSAIGVAQQAYQTVRRAAEFAYETVAEGAELNLAEERFNRLAASIGTTADALTSDLTQATGSMMSNAEMIRSASDIISLGLADNQEDVVRLANLVGQLGWDMQQVILTFANDSTKRLDSLGLSVSDVETRMKALEQQGIATEKAFDLAVIQAGEERLQLLGSAAGSTTGDLKTLEAAAADAFNAIKQDAADAVAPVIGHLADLIRTANDATGAVKTLADGVKEVGDPQVAQQIEEAVRKFGLLNALLHPEGYNQARQALLQYSAQIVKATDDTDQWVSMLKAEGIQISDGNAVLIGNMTVTMDELIEARRELIKQDLINQYTEENRALREYHQSEVDATDATEEQTDAIERQRPALDELVNLTGDRKRIAQEASIAQYEQAQAEERVAETVEAGRRAAEESIETVQARIDAQNRYNQTIGSGFIQALDAGEDAQLDFNQALLEELAALGAAPEVLNSAAFATGNYSAEQIEAAIQARVMAAEIEKTAAAVAAGDMTVMEATQHLQDFQARLAEDYKMTFNTEQIDGAVGKVQTLIDRLNAAAGTYEARVIVSSQGAGGQYATQEFRQHGGPVTAGQPYWVGEAGPELVVPTMSGYVLSHQQSMAVAGQAGGGAGSVIQRATFNANGVNDPRQFAREVMRYMEDRGMIPRGRFR